MDALVRGLVSTSPEHAKIVASLIPPDSVLLVARYIDNLAFFLASLFVDLRN